MLLAAGTWTALRRAGACLLVLALGACSVKTTVQATATTPAAVTHWYVTASAVWLNASATARSTDTTWLKIALKTPLTVDLYDPSHSLLPAVLSEASIPAGTYAQLQLVLIPNSTTLATSASALGLTYNDEVVYPGASGELTVPVEFPTQTPTLAVAADIVLKGKPTTSSITTSGSATTALATVTIGIDALRRLHFLTQTYANGTKQTFALCSARLIAADTGTSGAITGTVDVSAISSASLRSSQGLIATAETLSSDGTRHVAVASATVQVSGTTGTFTLYPLPVASTGSTTYDIVIHGPGVQTTLIQSVPAKAGAVTAATSVQSSAIALVAAGGYQVTMPGVTTSASGALSFDSGYSGTTPLPAGADVEFYATVASASAAPYLIESAAVNPLTRRLSATDASDLTVTASPTLVLANADVRLGTYNAGNAISLASTKPLEGTGAYRVAGGALLHADGALGGAAALVQPQPAAATAIVLYPVAPVSASGLAQPLVVSLTPGSYRYNAGTLLVSSGGVVVEAIDLGAALAASGNGATTFSVRVPGLPVGSATAPYLPALYDLEVRAWHSAYPKQGVRYSWHTGVDLSTGLGQTQTLTLP